VKTSIALVNPPRLHLLTKRPSYTNEPHLGLAYVAASLRENGYSVNFIDAETDRLTAEETATLALKDDPIFIGLSAYTALIKSAAKVAAAIKQLDPNRTVVIGGWHPTVLPKKTLEEFAEFDIAVFGEGEQVARELTYALENSLSTSDISGIVYRSGGQVIKNQPHHRVDDLDSLPFPAWDLFPIEKYQAHYTTNRNIIELPVNTGRGCPGRCKFCARVTGGVVRRRSVNSIMEEIHVDVGRFGAGAIVFMDETFTADPELAEELCERMIADGLNRKIYWLCQTRVDWVTPELLDVMGRAGCRHISFGVESGDPDILAGAGKGTDLGQITEAVRSAKRAGILVDNFFILGLPNETPRTLRKTVNLAVELDSDFANFFILVPYPGTKVYEMARRGEGGLRLLTDDWDMYGIQMGRSLELDGLPRSKLERAQFLAYLRFYLRPRKIRNMLRMVNLRVLPTYLWNLLAGWFRSRRERRVARETA